MEKLSVKCTPENRTNIGCDINKDKCVYCTTNGYCGDYHTATYEELLNAFDKLGQLKDAEEQRKKGCEYCTKQQTICQGNFSLTGPTKEIDNEMLITYSFYCAADDEYDDREIFTIHYCPRCGRKLV